MNNYCPSNGMVSSEMDVVDPMQEEQYEDYFKSYEDIDVHRLLLSDNARIVAYRDAIFNNSHLFVGKTVMDVGAGTGILSLFMAKAGARRVYAIEASNMARYIPAIAKLNGYQNVIEVINKKVEDVSLPPHAKVDVIVSEWMGFYLLHESMLSSVIFARDKFLVEGGVMFPSEARIYAAPCTLEEIHKQEIEFWKNVHGFDFSPLKTLAAKIKRQKPTVSSIKPSSLLSDPLCLKLFDMNYITNEEIKNFSCRNFVGITKTGNYQGLCLWFECDFNGIVYNSDGNEVGCSVTLSTSPFFPETHWKQTMIVFARENDTSTVNQDDLNQIENVNGSDNYIVEENEVVGWSLKFNQDMDNSRFYNLEIEILDAESEEHPIPCSCPMAKCLIISKMMQKEEEDIENMEEDL